MRGSLALALEKLKLLIYILFADISSRKYLRGGRYFTFLPHKDQRRGEIITSCCQNFPPTLSITLYFYCKLEAPLTVLRKFVYFAIAQFGRKSKNQSAMFCIPIFTANREWRNYLPICLVIMPEFYGGVKRRNIDLWPKTKLYHVNYQAVVSHRGTTARQTECGRKQDCPRRKTEIN